MLFERRGSMFIFLFLHLATTSITAFEWTSSSSLANGSTVPACPGQDVTLAWSYTPAADEHVMNVEWHYAAQGSGDSAVLATQVQGTFFAAPGFSQHVEFVSGAGIRIHNVTAADSGTYSVRVNINLHGSVISEVQTAELVVSAGSLTTDDQLHIQMLPDAVYDQSTQQYHVQLSCGHFKAEWAQATGVLWKTPTGQTLPSTSEDNGRFLFTVPNPVNSGEYTCVLDNTSPATRCLQADSPLHRGATINVDGVQSQMTIMEAKMKAQQMQMSERLQQLENTHRVEITNLTQQLETATQDTARLNTQFGEVLRENLRLQQDVGVVKQENADLKQEVQSLRQIVESLSGQTTSRGNTAGVSFHAFIQKQHYPVGATVKYSNVFTNDGNAFSEATGIFTAPVNGTYLFLASVVQSTAGAVDVADIDVEIRLDGSVVGTCTTSTSGGAAHHRQGSCQAIVSLRTGQRVWLRVAGHEFLPSGKESSASSFSGALIYV